MNNGADISSSHPYQQAFIYQSILTPSHLMKEEQSKSYYSTHSLTSPSYLRHGLIKFNSEPRLSCLKEKNERSNIHLLQQPWPMPTPLSPTLDTNQYPDHEEYNYDMKSLPSKPSIASPMLTSIHQNHPNYLQSLSPPPSNYFNSHLYATSNTQESIHTHERSSFKQTNIDVNKSALDKCDSASNGNNMNWKNSAGSLAQMQRPTTKTRPSSAASIMTSPSHYYLPTEPNTAKPFPNAYHSSQPLKDEQLINIWKPSINSHHRSVANTMRRNSFNVWLEAKRHLTSPHLHLQHRVDRGGLTPPSTPLFSSPSAHSPISTAWPNLIRWTPRTHLSSTPSAPYMNPHHSIPNIYSTKSIQPSVSVNNTYMPIKGSRNVLKTWNSHGDHEYANNALPTSKCALSSKSECQDGHRWMPQKQNIAQHPLQSHVTSPINHARPPNTPSLKPTLTRNTLGRPYTEAACSSLGEPSFTVAIENEKRTTSQFSNTLNSQMYKGLYSKYYTLSGTYQGDQDTMAILSVVGTLLQRMVDKNDASPPADHAITRFHAHKMPSISVGAYLERIARYANCSKECYILAIIYLDRMLQAKKSLIINALNIHRLLITSIMLAAKYLDDKYCNNAFYAKVGGVSSHEMNLLELELLFWIGFGLDVKNDIFQRYILELEKFNDIINSEARQRLVQDTPHVPGGNRKCHQQQYFINGHQSTEENLVVK